MRQIQNPRLRPVIELEPANYASEARMAASDWLRKSDAWAQSVADAGLSGLQAISLGSWFVLAEDFDQASLAIVVRNCLSESGIRGFPDLDGDTTEDLSDRVGGMAGGCALYDSDTPVLEPTCCCGLSDIGEWRRLVNADAGDFEALEMGHGNLTLQVTSESVVLREVSESQPHDIRDFTMSLETVKSALLDGTSIQRFLNSRIRSALKEIPELSGYSQSQMDILARLLAGLDD